MLPMSSKKSEGPQTERGSGGERGSAVRYVGVGRLFRSQSKEKKNG